MTDPNAVALSSWTDTSPKDRTRHRRLAAGALASAGVPVSDPVRRLVPTDLDRTPLVDDVDSPRRPRRMRSR